MRFLRKLVTLVSHIQHQSHGYPLMIL